MGLYLDDELGVAFAGQYIEELRQLRYLLPVAEGEVLHLLKGAGLQSHPAQCGVVVHHHVPVSRYPHVGLRAPASQLDGILERCTRVLGSSWCIPVAAVGYHLHACGILFEHGEHGHSQFLALLTSHESHAVLAAHQAGRQLQQRSAFLHGGGGGEGLAPVGDEGECHLVAFGKSLAAHQIGATCLHAHSAQEVNVLHQFGLHFVRLHIHVFPQPGHILLGEWSVVDACQHHIAQPCLCSL